MHLTLTRNMKAGKSILGTISCNGKTWLTLENAEYAIPYGVYPLSYTWSPKFKRLLPQITVPHRKGIRIHPGNFASETKGCILIGEQVRSAGDEFALTDSRRAMARLLTLPFVPLMKSACPSDIEVTRNPHFTLNYFDEWSTN